MFSSLAHLARANPFNTPHLQLMLNTPHLQLMHDCTTCRVPAAPPIPLVRLSVPTTYLASAVEEYSCEFGSMKYYGLCGFGGVLSCGLTQTAVVPLDLVKCCMQVNPQGFSTTLKEDGVHGLAKGWAPALIGYCMQGLCKSGFYEVFKAL